MEFPPQGQNQKYLHSLSEFLNLFFPVPEVWITRHLPKFSLSVTCGLSSMSRSILAKFVISSSPLPTAQQTVLSEILEFPSQGQQYLAKKMNSLPRASRSTWLVIYYLAISSNSAFPTPTAQKSSTFAEHIIYYKCLEFSGQNHCHWSITLRRTLRNLFPPTTLEYSYGQKNQRKCVPGPAFRFWGPLL